MRKGEVGQLSPVVSDCRDHLIRSGRIYAAGALWRKDDSRDRRRIFHLKSRYVRRRRT